MVQNYNDKLLIKIPVPLDLGGCTSSPIERDFFYRYFSHDPIFSDRQQRTFADLF
jgi:hypothetical protein